MEVQDGPGLEAGLRPGDRLLAIDGESVAGLSGQEIHQLLSGEVGSFVELRVLRDEEVLDLRVERAPYKASRRR